MDCYEFLRKVWPVTGHYCVAMMQATGFRHLWFDSIDRAGDTILRLDDEGRTVYFACASFAKPGSRKAENALAVRSCWLDLDVGGEGKFSSVEDAGVALKAFVAKHDLPTPLVVSSGGGLHAYFLFEEDTPAAQARATAQLIKELAMIDGFRIDHTRTADMASVLRPVGTHNRKFDPPRLVRALTNPYPGQF